MQSKLENGVYDRNLMFPMSIPPAEIDLDAYFARIGSTASRKPTLALLHAIIAHHIVAIPFENLDVLLGRPILLDPASLQQKLIRDRRGGYCFEQNGLLLLVLTALGFQAVPLSARVRIQRPRDFTPPRTHLFIRVEIAGETWLADVGIGGLSPTAALRLNDAGEQSTLHEPRRILRENGRFFRQVKLGDEWSDVCEFTGEEMPLIDREVSNWWTSTNPRSTFRQNLTVACAGSDGTRRAILQSRVHDSLRCAYHRATRACHANGVARSSHAIFRLELPRRHAIRRSRLAMAHR